ncbi:MAG: hypothetical protein JST00_37625 [Deltaproteobacteria bacterium]|nr:hypothetical protein [Deltaproteobacteria bacterium]
MKTGSLLALSLALSAGSLAGCSGGDDVYIREDRTAARETGPTCVVGSGEAACIDLASQTFPPTPRTVEGIVALVDMHRIALRAVGTLSRACGAIVDELGVARPTAAPGDDLRASAERVCDVAQATIRARRAGITIEPSLATCGAQPDRAAETGLVCASPDPKCLSASVLVWLGADRSPQSLALVATLERHLPAVLSVKTELERLAELTKRLPTDATTELDGACVVGVVQMTTTALDHITTAARVSGSVLATLQ